MNIEELVPPLELCKKIPEGSFADSAFVWVFNHQKARKAYPKTAEDDAYFDLELRDIVEAGEQAVEKGKEVWTNRPPYYPAPTLQEIMEDLPKDDAYNDFVIEYGTKLGWFAHYLGDRKRRFFGEHLPTVALKLWLKQKGMAE